MTLLATIILLVLAILILWLIKGIRKNQSGGW